MLCNKQVSTHSRPKAAGRSLSLYSKLNRSFNTQPPEGGWTAKVRSASSTCKFQHTAARRRLAFPCSLSKTQRSVSTHSRPKAAGIYPKSHDCPFRVSTHSRPKAAGPWILRRLKQRIRFNTQPPEGGWVKLCLLFQIWQVSTHSRPKAAGKLRFAEAIVSAFQHTAARRRLVRTAAGCVIGILFQHTAARRRLVGKDTGSGLTV